jgi:hypothetical protein
VCCMHFVYKQNPVVNTVSDVTVTKTCHSAFNLPIIISGQKLLWLNWTLVTHPIILAIRKAGRDQKDHGSRPDQESKSLSQKYSMQKGADGMVPSCRVPT